MNYRITKLVTKEKKKRHKVTTLLRKARKGDKKAKEKLQARFGIRLYSAKERKKYQKENLKNHRN